MRDGTLRRRIKLLRDELLSLKKPKLRTGAKRWNRGYSRIFGEPPAAAAGGPSTGLVHWHTGHWYHSLIVTHLMTATAVITGNRLWAFAYPISRTATYDRIGIDIALGEAAVNARLGLYADNGNGYPGALIEDAGVVSLAAPAGNKNIAFSAAQQLTERNLYWIAVVTNSTTAQTRYGTSNLSVLGHATWKYNQYASVYRAYAYAALPDPWGAGGTYYHYMYAVGLKLASVP